MSERRQSCVFFSLFAWYVCATATFNLPGITYSSCNFNGICFGIFQPVCRSEGELCDITAAVLSYAGLRDDVLWRERSAALHGARSRCVTPSAAILDSPLELPGNCYGSYSPDRKGLHRKDYSALRHCYFFSSCCSAVSTGTLAFLLHSLIFFSSFGGTLTSILFN